MDFGMGARRGGLPATGVRDRVLGSFGIFSGLVRQGCSELHEFRNRNRAGVLILIYDSTRAGGKPHSEVASG
jgi:hypothetical protein